MDPRRASLSLMLTVSLLAVSKDASAQVSIDTDRGTPYYLSHSLVSAALLGSYIAFARPRFLSRGSRWSAFGRFDSSVELYFNDGAARLSDTLAASTAFFMPAATHWGLGVDTALGNTTVVYTQALAANLLLNGVVKYAVGRPRPYMSRLIRTDRRAQQLEQADPNDAYLSFYSGHSSTAFAGAAASSILFSLRSDDPLQTHVVWGAEFFAAGATASLRVSAGRHHRSDVIVGVLVGTALGYGFPAAHKLDLSRVKPTEMGVGTAAATLGFGLVELLRPSSEAIEAPPETSWTLFPARIGGAPGLVTAGEF
ncbi:MAG: phosphatase PAP2 family protein [Myxococcales bacterium]|nr:phosphatase PAP2 family protein [Myxococcales bacterium]